MTTRDDLIALMEALDATAGEDTIADAILKRFLVVPLSDIQASEYGSSDGSFMYRHQTKADVLKAAAEGLTPMQRPILPWTPIHEGGEAQ